jgi:hypothetical protein
VLLSIWISSFFHWLLLVDLDMCQNIAAVSGNSTNVNTQLQGSANQYLEEIKKNADPNA